MVTSILAGAIVGAVVVGVWSVVSEWADHTVAHALDDDRWWSLEEPELARDRSLGHARTPPTRVSEAGPSLESRS